MYRLLLIILSDPSAHITQAWDHLQRTFSGLADFAQDLLVVKSNVDKFNLASFIHQLHFSRKQKDYTVCGILRDSAFIREEWSEHAISSLSASPTLACSPKSTAEPFEPFFNTVEEALKDFQQGKFVIVVDNEDRENEGDLIIAAEDMTEEKMAFMVRYTSGVICTPMTKERLDTLELPLMVERNTESLQTAYTITVDCRIGTTTGISAHDRAATVKQLAVSNEPTDFNRPGHVFPLQYREGGVLVRPGHTEASVDLCNLSGKNPVAVISEIVLDDGRMARRDDLMRLAREWDMKIITIESLIEYRIKYQL